MSAQMAQYEQQVLGHVGTGLHARFASIIDAGRDPEQVLGDPEAVAERMLATVPDTHPWDVQIGPFYDTPGVTKLLGISKQAVADRVKRRTILSGTTRQGRVVYPALQFRGHRIMPEISAVSAVFADCPVDGWAVCAWFTTPAANLSGRTPVEWLKRGGPVDPVAELAAETASRWR